MASEFAWIERVKIGKDHNTRVIVGMDVLFFELRRTSPLNYHIAITKFARTLDVSVIFGFAHSHDGAERKENSSPTLQAKTSSDNKKVRFFSMYSGVY